MGKSRREATVSGFDAERKIAAQRDAARALGVQFIVMGVVFGAILLMGIWYMPIDIARTIQSSNDNPYWIQMLALQLLILVFRVSPPVVLVTLGIRKLRSLSGPQRQPLNRVPKWSPPQDVTEDEFVRARRAVHNRLGLSGPLSAIVWAMLMVLFAVVLTTAGSLATGVDPLGAGGVLRKTAPSLLMSALAAIAIVVGYHLIVKRRNNAIEGTTVFTADTEALQALENACIASGAPRMYLRMLDQPGVNAFIWSGDRSVPAIVVTRGMLKRLDRSGLTVVFTNLLARLDAGIAREAATDSSDVALVASDELMRANETADAHTLMHLQDPHLMLESMLRVGRSDNRIQLPVSLSAACFFAWPYSPARDDMRHRMRDLAELAGQEGETWWQSHLGELSGPTPDAMGRNGLL